MAPAGYGSSVEGIHAVAAAAAAGRVTRLWVERGRAGRDEVSAIVEMLPRDRVSIVDDVRDKAETTAPQGVVAECRPIPAPDLPALRDRADSLIVLDHVEDPHNLGAVARSVAAAGLGGMVVPARRSAPLSAAAFKAAAGALERVPVAVVNSVPEALSRLKDLDNQQIRERVDAYVKKIQATLRGQIQADSELAGMGTTWTSAHLLAPQALVVHIGDSRAYLLHQGNLHQVTRDETVAQALIDSGADPQSVSRFRHMLLNSFGGDTDTVTAQIHQLQIDAGDQLLLCTDGLTDMVSDEGIASILQSSTSPQSACDRLIGAALENGGHDNVTAILAAAV